MGVIKITHGPMYIKHMQINCQTPAWSLTRPCLIILSSLACHKYMTYSVQKWHDHFELWLIWSNDQMSFDCRLSHLSFGHYYFLLLEVYYIHCLERRLRSRDDVHDVHWSTRVMLIYKTKKQFFRQLMQLKVLCSIIIKHSLKNISCN